MDPGGAGSAHREQPGNEVLFVGTDKKIYHLWTAGGSEALIGKGTPEETFSGQAVPGTLSATWDNDGHYLHMVAGGTNGQGYLKVMMDNGTVHMDWTPIPNCYLGLPGGGAAGPPGPDVRPQVAAALQAAVKALS